MLIEIFLVFSSFWCIFDSLQVVVDYFSYQSVKWILNLSILAHFGKDVYEVCFSDIISGTNITENSISYTCCQIDTYRPTLSAPKTLVCNTVPRNSSCHQTFGLEQNEVLCLSDVSNFFTHGGSKYFHFVAVSFPFLFLTIYPFLTLMLYSNKQVSEIR